MTDTPRQSTPQFERDDSVSQSEQMRARALPAARADLQISPQLYLGRTVYVVKDPVSLQYYRLQPAEHYVLKHLDGQRSANQLAHEVCRRFPDNPIDPDDVMLFVKMLHNTGLLLGSGAHGAQLREMRRLQIRRKRFATMTNFLFIKIPVLDPDDLLDALYKIAAPIMNRATCIAALLFMAAAGLIAILNLDKISHAHMPILSWQNLLIMSCVFFGVKVIHEFGHGLAAKHRGLEVHEMGVLLMVFIPMFYVDTSDAWMVPRKRDRLWITAGGVFIEFLFAACAVWVWLWTEPGIINLVALDIMIAASVTTILFNANPLLRYDGYYFLMDWLEIPNLKSKANAFLGFLAKRYILAMHLEEPPAEASTHPIFMPIYAVASSVYRVMITFAIIALVWHILDPYGLEALGSMLGMAAIVLMIVVPLFKFFRFVWKQQAKTGRRMAATAVGLCALGLVLYAVWSIPVDQTIEQPTVALADQRRTLFVPDQGGRVVEVFVTPSKHLKAGDPILRMEDPDLIEQYESLAVDIDIARLQLNISRAEGKQEKVAALNHRIALLLEQREYLQRRIDNLTVTAPIDGRLYVQGNMNALLGAHLKRGEQIGKIVGDGRRELVVVLPQGDAALVQPGMPVQLRLWAMTGRTFEGRVDRLGSQFIKHLPHESLSSRYKGEVDTTAVDRYNSSPVTPSVLARIDLDQTVDASLFDGMTGRSKITTGQTTFGAQQWRLARQAMSLDWWL